MFFGKLSRSERGLWALSRREIERERADEARVRTFIHKNRIYVLVRAPHTSKQALAGSLLESLSLSHLLGG